MYDFLSEKVRSLSSRTKHAVKSNIPLVLGDRRGSYKYIPIVGLELDGLENSLLGEDADGYCQAVMDAISIGLGLNSGTRNISVCLDSSLVVAKLWGLQPSLVTAEELKSQWGYGSSIDVSDGDSNSSDVGIDDGDSNVSLNEPDGVDVEVDDDVSSDDSKDKEPEADNKTIRDAITRVFGNRVVSSLEAIVARYDLLFASGYDLERPYGIVTEGGIFYVDSDKVLKDREKVGVDLDCSSSRDLYAFFKDKIGFVEGDSRSALDISSDMIEGFNLNCPVLYFPYKLLEYVYGRNSSRKASNVYEYATYEGKGVASDWTKFKNKVRLDVKLTIEDSLVMYCKGVLGINDDTDNIKDILMSNTQKVSEFIDYVSRSLSTCILITKYSSVGGKPSVLKMKVCDPTKNISIGDKLTSQLVQIVSPGNTGGNSGLDLGSSLNPKNSEDYNVYEYAYEFDHSLANAMPLFAYKVLDVLKERGEMPTFKSLILGQGDDGTIIRNGSHGIELSKNLFHIINAGSRSGKGVMTLNLLAGALMSNKAVIYLDNKPDMATVLCELAGGCSKSGPPMFAINGSNSKKPTYAPLPYTEEWVNRNNIPIEAVRLFGEPKWDGKYGDIFYMRAMTLALGIIFARGTGMLTNEDFNGENGIFLVCDETNVLQTGFVASAISPMTDAIGGSAIPVKAADFTAECRKLIDIFRDVQSGKKGSESKLASELEAFSAAFSASRFYGVAFLNMLSDNLRYAQDLSRAGFLPAEVEQSDVVIIGQDLEQVPFASDEIGMILSSERYKFGDNSAMGLYAGAASRLRGAKSIPMSHFVFRSSDALIGYNEPRGEYLAQRNPQSKANGRLDLVANNFCYIPSFSIATDGSKPGSQLTKEIANRSTSIYFKPYLILNKFDPQADAENGFVGQMLKRVGDAGISQEQLISEYPDRNGDGLNPCIGLPEYLERAGISNLAERLKLGASIVDNILRKYIKYPDDGSGRPLWLQYITDLRVEWMLSTRDIANLCCGSVSGTNIYKGKDNPISLEYNRYISFVEEHRELGIVDPSMSVSASTYVDEDGNTQYDVSGYESDARRDFYAMDDGLNPDDESRAYNERMDRCFSDDDILFDEDDDDVDYADILDEDDGYDVLGLFDNNEGNDSKEIDEKDEVIARLVAEVESLRGELLSYRVNPNQTGVDCGVTGADSRQQYSGNDFDGLQFDSQDEDVSANTFASLVKLITEKVLSAYGGVERVGSFKVVGGAIAINNVVYRSEVSRGLSMGSLPLDIRRKVNSGNIAELFDYRQLKRMPNLRLLSFDSSDFVISNVVPMMGYRNLSVGNFFDDIKSLFTLVISNKEFLRETYKEVIGNNPEYSYRSRSTRSFTIVDSGLSKATRATWTFTKNMFTTRNHNMFVKTLGILAGGVATVATGAATLGNKATKGISGQVDRRSRVKSSLASLKSSIGDLFNT